ncbi:unnamed protein product, partial [marine sediment metagenome]
ILAAIAVPNFLEAQVRTKVSRVKSDFRSVATAIEAYRVDFNDYPWFDNGAYPKKYGALSYRLWNLTTPVAYITTVNFRDPFVMMGTWGNYNDDLLRYQYNYRNYKFFGNWGFDCWVLNSLGPDRVKSQGLKTEIMIRGLDTSATPTIIYDSTNGTKSAGDIPWTGGDTRYTNR